MNNDSPRPDFPSWLPPTLVKELRQGMRSPAFLIMMCALPILIALGFALSFIGQMMTRDLINMDIIKFIGFKGALITGLLLVQPIRAMAGIREEIDARTMDMLSLTRLSARRIVLGKWLSLMFQSLLLVFACLPFLFVMYFFGNVNLAEEFYLLVCIIALGGLLTASALWVSAYSALLRGIWSFALLWAAIMSIVIMCDSSVMNFDNMGWVKWPMLATVLAQCALMTLLFLLLTAKRIAPPADNLSASIRKWLLAGLLWGLPLAGCSAWTSFDYKDFPMGLSWTIFGFSLLVLLLESLDPDTTLRRHLVKKNGKKASLFRRIFLLPDQESSLAFILLYMGLSLPTLYLLVEDVTFGSLPSPILLALWLAGTIAYSLFATSIILTPLRKHLKSGLFFLAAVLMGLGPLLSSILCKMDLTLFAALIPWGNIFTPEIREAKSELPACLLGFFLSMLAMGITFCMVQKKRPSLTPPSPAGAEPSPSSES